MLAMSQIFKTGLAIAASIRFERWRSRNRRTRLIELPPNARTQRM